MAKFRIKYALGGGFGGLEHAEWEEIEAESFEEAEQYAYESACGQYESYFHDDVSDKDEAWEVYCNERENWITYCAEEVK